jgi:hypothetical protein
MILKIYYLYKPYLILIDNGLIVNVPGGLAGGQRFEKKTLPGDLNPPPDNASGGQEPFCKRVPGPPKTFYQVLFLALSLSVSSRVFAVYKNRRWIQEEQDG